MKADKKAPPVNTLKLTQLTADQSIASGANSIVCEGIPWVPKQGKLAEEQGIQRRITGNERRVCLT
jgi:hypothetical protein